MPDIARVNISSNGKVQQTSNVIVIDRGLSRGWRDGRIAACLKCFYLKAMKGRNI